MIMSNRYLSAMSRSTAPVSESENLRHGRHLLAAQMAARRGDRDPDMRIAADALDFAGGGVGVHQEPAVRQTNHTGVATPGRLAGSW